MNTMTIKKDEYRRLKKLDVSFSELFEYFADLKEIRDARKQVKSGKTISQEKLFERLGL